MDSIFGIYDLDILLLDYLDPNSYVQLAKTSRYLHGVVNENNYLEWLGKSFTPLYNTESKFNYSAYESAFNSAPFHTLNYVKWIHHHFEPYINHYTTIRMVFVCAVLTAHFDIALWTYQLAVQKVVDHLIYSDLDGLFRKICCSHLLENVKWLYKWSGTIGHQIDSQMYPCLEEACRRNEKDVVEWLYTLEQQEPREEYNRYGLVYEYRHYGVFRCACMNNHIDIAELIIGWNKGTANYSIQIQDNKIVSWEPKI